MNDNHQEIVHESTVTCPECGSKTDEQMPENACRYFWECPHCKAVTKAKKGDCCVFCSYGTHDCPPVQRGSACCG